MRIKHAEMKVQEHGKRSAREKTRLVIFAVALPNARDPKAQGRLAWHDVMSSIVLEGTIQSARYPEVDDPGFRNRQKQCD